jgi:hypothetical protein
MKLQELQKLAEKVQLKIKPEKAGYLLDSLSKLEKLLERFRKLELKDNYQPLAKITLKSLCQLAEKLSVRAVKQENILHNATVSTKSFLIIRKKNN